MQNNQGVTITLEDVLHLDITRKVKASEIEFIENKTCPCCTNELLPVSVLKESGAEKSVRLGHCSVCGYIGYIDKPTEDWVENFYNEVWDVTTQKKIENIEPTSYKVFIDTATDLGIPKDTSVFDIGTGYGQILKQFSDEGFDKLFGTEHSPHRADVASEYAKANVLSVPFSNKEVDNFKKGAPYGLMLSKSVLEHVYDPGDFFSAIASLQGIGGHVFIAVPNAVYEAGVTTSFFVPHLHAFSKQALASLAARYGYGVVKMEEHGSGLIMVAKKESEQKIEPAKFDFPDHSETLLRWKKEMHADELAQYSKICWINNRFIETHGIVPKSDGALVSKLVISLYKSIDVLPKSIKRPLLRVLLGISRRHNAYAMKLKESGDGGDALTIELKELFLTYK